MKSREYLFYIAVGLYLVSLVLPGIAYQPLHGQPIPPDYGFMLLLGGIPGLFMGQFAWWANVLALLAVIAMRSGKPGRGTILALLAFGIGLQSFLFLQKPLDEGVSTWHNVDHLGIGFYIWELSFLALFAHGIVKVFALGQGKKLFLMLIGICLLIAGGIYLLFPLTRPEEEFFSRIRVVTKICAENNLAVEMLYGKPGCGATFGPDAPRGWIYKKISGENTGKFVIEMRNLYGDSIVCNEKACPSVLSDTKSISVMSSLDSFPVAENTWKNRFLKGEEVPSETYRVYYFNTNNPNVAVKEDEVKSIAISYSWDEGPGFKVPSEDFGAYWIGSFSTDEEKAMLLTLSQTWAEARVILDGRVIYEGGPHGEINRNVLVPKGVHIVEVEYTNNWHTTEFSASLSQE